MAGARLGHAHLFVRDVEASAAFYADVLGLEVTEAEEGRWAFLSSGEEHHELALSEVGPDAPAPAEGAVGLFHLGFDARDEAHLAGILRRLLDRRVEVRPIDHRISWGVYFEDPDGNTLEICLDRRGRAGGAHLWQGRNRPLTVQRVLEGSGGDGRDAP